jgi:integrase
MPREPKPWFWKQRGQWVVNIGRIRHYLGPDRKAAFEEFYRLMRQPPKTHPVGPQSVAALIDIFLDWVQKHRAPDTYEWYRFRCQRFCERYPNLRLDQLKPYHVQEWADGYEFSKTSRRNYLRAVKRSFSWAAKQGYVDQNPIQHLEIPAANHREVVISEAEFLQILEMAGHDSLRNLIVVTRECGCRPQESLRVEARHVDLRHQRWVFPQSEAKGEIAPRIVYLTDEAMLITQKLMREHPKGKLFRNSLRTPWTVDAVNCGFDRIQQRMGKVEMRRQGKTVTDDDIKALIPKLKKTRKRKGQLIDKTPAELRLEAKQKLTNLLVKSLAPRYSLYAIRHSWATRALEQGLDSVTVAVLMGHADPSMLARVYQHLSQNPKYLLEQAKRAVARA